MEKEEEEEEENVVVMEETNMEASQDKVEETGLEDKR